jgi:hypothetical protein
MFQVFIILNLNGIVISSLRYRCRTLDNPTMRKFRSIEPRKFLLVTTVSYRRSCSYAIHNTDVPTSFSSRVVNRCVANVSQIDGLRRWCYTKVRHSKFLPLSLFMLSLFFDGSIADSDLTKAIVKAQGHM